MGISEKGKVVCPEYRIIAGREGQYPKLIFMRLWRVVVEIYRVSTQLAPNPMRVLISPKEIRLNVSTTQFLLHRTGKDTDDRTTRHPLLHPLPSFRRSVVAPVDTSCILRVSPVLVTSQSGERFATNHSIPGPANVHTHCTEA